ncbi:MAG: hypothetical protein M1830_002571 [Pleopsidium flavum]|nr:MAG: hypothetical protein M1830_002571 [Pleopsidium flavum]
METLLSLSFDYLSSYDASKIRKGLRQVEGLLAQICLSNSQSSAIDRRRSVIPAGTPPAQAKELGALKDDPAFREFFKLQEGFEWNDGQNDLLIVSTLDLIQGILLLHPPSRSLFAREIYMNLLLDLLDPSNCPAIQSSTLLTLVVTLLDHPLNTRTFETLDGLLTVTSLFKMRATSREVKLKLIEFLYFYLMPEAPPSTTMTSVSAPATAVLQRSPSKIGGEAMSRSVNGAGKETAEYGEGIRTTEEKQGLLGRYLNNVEDLVDDLRDNAPFGGTVYDKDSNPLQAIDDIELSALLPHFLSLLQQAKPTSQLKIVDLGCGTGRNTVKVLCVPGVQRVVGLDASEKMLAIAKERCEECMGALGADRRNVDFVLEVYDVLDDDVAASLSDSARGADAIVSTLVLEHLPLDAFFAAVSEILRPGGLVMVTNMHPDMGAKSQAGFVDPETGEKIRPVSYVHKIEDVVSEARRRGLELVGQVKEKEVKVSDLEDGGVGDRGRKWIGVRTWFGMVLRKAKPVIELSRDRQEV